MAIGKSYFSLYKLNGRWVDEDERPVVLQLQPANIEIKSKGEIEIIFSEVNSIASDKYRILIDSTTGFIISIKKKYGFSRRENDFEDIDVLHMRYNHALANSFFIQEGHSAIAVDN